jgi:hypothetical protein
MASPATNTVHHNTFQAVTATEYQTDGRDHQSDCDAPAVSNPALNGISNLRQWIAAKGMALRLHPQKASGDEVAGEPI